MSFFSNKGSDTITIENTSVLDAYEKAIDVFRHHIKLPIPHLPSMI